LVEKLQNMHAAAAAAAAAARIAARFLQL